jgi:hypothetical protein
MKHRALVWIFPLLLLSSLSARGQEEPDRFLIERITVEGTKEAAANIVRSETLLRPGDSYNEGELRLAVYRVHRLPFVLDASFSLRKGSRRGAYELVIEVRPARWFFYDLWFRAFAFDQPLDLGTETFSGYRSSASVGSVAGARRFVGRSGVLFAALDSEEGIQAGFTQYDLLDRGILASAGISRNVCCVTEVLPLALDPTFSAWTFDTSLKLSLGISIPLNGPQSIQITASERRGERGSRSEVLVGPGLRENPRSGGGEELSYRRAEAKWVFDTSDDPVFPTRGVSISAGMEASRFAARDLDLTLDPGSPETVVLFYPDYRSEQVVGAISVIRHWALTSRQTVSLMGRVSAGQSRLDHLAVKEGVIPHVDADYYAGSAGVEHAWTLRRSRVAGELSDLRLETGVEIGGEKTIPDLGPSPLKRFSAHTGFVYRNPWGRIRLIFTYLDFHEVMR